METVKSYTSLEQSKKLAEFLQLESADMFWEYNYDEHSHADVPYVLTVNNWDDAYNKDIPCWSLAALLSVLPPIEGFRPIIDLDIHLIRYEGNYRDKLCFNGNNFVDACYEMIIKLNELNLL